MFKQSRLYLCFADTEAKVTVDPHLLSLPSFLFYAPVLLNYLYAFSCVWVFAHTPLSVKTSSFSALTGYHYLSCRT